MNDEEFLAEVRRVFDDESTELLEDFESVLLKLEDEPDDDALINELFRTVHTIKGSAGILGYDDVVGFTHIAESVMGRLRDKELPLDETLIGLFLASCDHSRDLIRQAVDTPDEPLAEASAAEGARLIQSLSQYLDEGAIATADPAAAKPEQPAREDGGSGESERKDLWHISLRMEPDALQNGLDPLYFFNYLASVGEIVELTTLAADLPALAELQPETLYLGFEIDLDSNADKETIASVFDFMRGECTLHILPPSSQVADYMLLINELPEENMAIGEILVASGVLTEDELADALRAQESQTVTEMQSEDGTDPVAVAVKPQLGEVLVNKGVADRKVVDAALQKQNRVRIAAENEHQSLRVSTARLESLVNLVGELVIASAQAELRVRQTEQKSLIESADQLHRLVEEIRDATLGLRMMPVGDTFNRYKRVVRDTSKELGKKIELEIRGGATELDKTVIERISDPLMHLIRNALDHGVETPEERVARGKPETATVSLEAYHDSGSIVIELADDGRGLDPDMLVAKAIEKGVITPRQQLSIGEIHRLIFAPGFSTADEVTNLSGRGVGMDVVNRNIDALRGQISVKSELGAGTRFIIRLPLTLAIIDGFQVQVGKSSFVIPLDLVDECIELDSLETATQSGDYIDLRGEVMPYLRLAELFSETSPGEKFEPRNNLVIVHYGGQRTGLVVDKLLGEHQTVIKPLGPVFQNLKGISGATILGDGEVAMIIDVPALIAQAANASLATRGTRGLH